MEKVIYLLPAPDMDERSIKAIQLNGYSVVPVSLDPIDSKTDLTDYVQNLSKQIKVHKPIVIGACYGGPLAIELSKFIEIEKLVLVACIKDRKELTFRWKLLYRFYILLPCWLERMIGASLRFLINKVLRISIKVPRIWLKGGQNRFIARHLLTLSKEKSQINKLIHIHGNKDKIFPIDKIEDVDTTLEAGHFMLDKQRKAVLSAMLNAVHDSAVSKT